MYRNRFFLTLLIFLSLGLGAGFGQSLSGVVTDAENNPLPNVNISIPALETGKATDAAGKFQLQNLPAGVFTVEFSMIGYKTETRRVVLSEDEVHLRVILSPSPLEFAPVTVTAQPQPTDLLSSPVAVTVIDAKRLRHTRDQTVIASLESAGVPGLRVFSTGSGIAKPVIRGMTSQRVLVLTDGVRQEDQSWADDHAPEVDALSVDRVEVVRGPNSVLYGADALGGVLNIIGPEVPSLENGSPRLAGRLLFGGFSNNEQLSSALSLFGANRLFGYRFNLSGRHANNLNTPNGELSNSGTEELNGSGMIGIKRTWGSLVMDYHRTNRTLQIHEDPQEEPDADPFQKVKHDKVHLHGQFLLPVARLELNGAWQRNRRQEFEEGDAPEPALHLLLNTFSLDLKAHHHPFGTMFGSFGFSVMRQKNETLGEEALIPGFELLSAGAFLYEEATFEPVTLSGGLRFDRRTVEIAENEDLGVRAQDLDYSAVNGTFGAVLRLQNNLALALNTGTGWRTPSPFELFINGVHEGTRRFEIGDNRLRSERSFNVETSLRYSTARSHAEITLFRNSVERLIFLSPTGETDPESGLGIFRYQQADASFEGIELSAETQLMRWLVVSGGFDALRAENEQTGLPLPLIPANRFRVGVRLVGSTFGSIRMPYLTLSTVTTFEQNRVAPFESETDGYTLFNMTVGGDFSLWDERISASVEVRNLFDIAYRSHLSRYKTYALNPGRNVIMRATVPIDLLR